MLLLHYFYCLFTSAKKNATKAEQKSPEKVEVFVNDKKVLVDPGTTVLQVNSCAIDVGCIVSPVIIFILIVQCL